MSDEAMWARRVLEWKSSGQTSEAYCEGKAYTAGGLRQWAYRQRQEGRRKADRPALRIARMLRVPARPVASGPAVGAAELVVEIGAARVTVRAGCDGVTLATVLEILAARGAQ